MGIDIEDTLAGLDLLGKRVDGAVRQSTSDALHLFERYSVLNTPIGIPGNTTNPPGELAASIIVTGPEGSDGVYTGLVGPTTIYGRQRELGGDIYPQTAKALHFWKFEDEIFTIHVHQFGAHYMEQGYEEAKPDIEGVVYERVGQAILGAD